MSVTPEILTRAWMAIRARIPCALPGTVLEQALPVPGEIGLSAAVWVNDAMPGIMIRVPSRWPASAWEVLRLAGVRFAPPIADHQYQLFPVIMADEDCVGVFAVFVADLASILSLPGPIETRMLTQCRSGLCVEYGTLGFSIPMKLRKQSPSRRENS